MWRIVFPEKVNDMVRFLFGRLPLAPVQKSSYQNVDSGRENPDYWRFLELVKRDLM